MTFNRINLNLNKTVAYLALILLFTACADSHEIKPARLPDDIPSLEKHLNDGLAGDTRLQAYYMLYGRYLYKDNDKAEWYIDELLKLAKEENSQPYIARAKHGKGYVKQIKGDYLGALPSLLYAVDLFDEIGDATRMTDDINNIGLVFLKSEGYQDAIPYFEKAANIYQEVGDLKFLMDTYANLAICQYKLKNYPIAFDNISKAIDCQYKVDANDKEFLAYLYNVAGNIKYLNKQYNDALEHYNQAWTLEGVSNEIKADIAHNFVNTYTQKGEAYYNKAETWLNQAKIYQAQSANIENQNLVRQYNIEGTFYQSQGNHKKAIEIFENAIDKADKNIINEPLGKTLDLLTASYRASETRLDNSSLLSIIEIKDQQYALKESFYNGMNAKALQAALNQEVEKYNFEKKQAGMQQEQASILKFGGLTICLFLIGFVVFGVHSRQAAIARQQLKASSQALEAENHDLMNSGKRLYDSYQDMIVKVKTMSEEIEREMARLAKEKEDLKKYDDLLKDD